MEVLVNGSFGGRTRTYAPSQLDFHLTQFRDYQEQFNVLITSILSLNTVELQIYLDVSEENTTSIFIFMVTTIVKDGETSWKIWTIKVAGYTEQSTCPLNQPTSFPETFTTYLRVN